MVRIVAACLGGLALAFSAAGATAAPPPLSAYGALPAIEEVAISASGANLAYMTVIGEQRRLVMQTVDAKPLGVLAVGDSKVRGIEWAGDDHVVILTTATAAMSKFGIGKGEWPIAHSYTPKTNRMRNLAAKTDWTFINQAPVLRQVDGKWYAFIETHDSTSPTLQLYRVSLDEGHTRLIETMASPGAQGWMINAAGQPVARISYDTVSGQWSLGVKRGGSWPQVYQAEAKLDPPGVVGFGRDGQSIVMRESASNGGRYLEVAADGSARLAAPQDRVYADLVFDPASKRLIGATYFEDGYHYSFFDPADQASWNAVLKAFKGQRVRLTSWSADRRKVVIFVDGPQSAGIYYLVDLTARRADIIGDAYPGVPSDQVAEVKPYTYTAADGAEVPGYLTLPRGRDPRKLPLVVMPHGGPEAHDSPTFDYWAQAIASRGYAVLQPNYRGSTGYGSDWVKAGYGEWGRKMQTDLSDGVKALAAEGVIDPRRVCIVGASYGGYAAMAGVTIQQGIYRCAVAFGGVSDLRGMLNFEARDAGRKSLTMRYWRRFMGVTNDNDPALEGISPLRNAAGASAPILLIHGKDDTVVPFRQSASFADALRKAGKPVELVTLTGEDHWLSRNETRQQMLEATVGFLLKENPPQ